MGTLDSEHVFLKWNNFENNLASGFADLLQQEAMVDVTLAVEGKLVQAHKIVLSICSSYFRNMFQVNPCQHPIVILKDVGYEELVDMLDFMYRGEVNVKQQDLPSFLRLAETLKVKGLAGSYLDASTHRQQSDVDMRKEASMVNIKHATPNETKEDLRGRDSHVRKGGSMMRKKQKRSGSPMKGIDFKINIRDDEYDGYDNDLDRKCSYVQDISCINIKEERLNYASFYSCVEDGVSDVADGKMLTGSSKSDDSPEAGRRCVDDVGESEMSDSKLLPGPSKSDEPSEVIPQDSTISRRASKPLSLIWSFFNFDCHENKSECKLCGKVFKACPKTGTASVKYHLHFAHQILRNEGECKYIQ